MSTTLKPIPYWERERSTPPVASMTPSEFKRFASLDEWDEKTLTMLFKGDYVPKDRILCGGRSIRIYK